MEDYRHETMMMADYDILNDIIDTIMEAYEELDGSKKYIKAAMARKAVDKKTADRLVTMSAEELGHAESLCEGVESMLQKAEEENNDCVSVVRKMWTHLYDRMASYKAWIKQLHTDYKSM